jgi:hypothetical protein
MSLADFSRAVAQHEEMTVDFIETARLAIYEENDRGGEARGVIYDAAKLLDINLGDDIRDGDIWSVENMRRIITRIETLTYDNRRLKGLPEGSFA